MEYASAASQGCRRREPLQLTVDVRGVRSLPSHTTLPTTQKQQHTKHTVVLCDTRELVCIFESVKCYEMNIASVSVIVKS